MKGWVIPTIMFCIGLSLGLGGPILANQYLEPYMPSFLKKPLHPLEGIVTHKQREQDRLLMTVTTQDGTILATFRKQVAEIALLVDEQDSITLDVKQYEPFVNDPPVLKVNKQVPQVQAPSAAPASPQPPSIEREALNDPPLESAPLPSETPAPVEPAPPTIN